MLKKKSDHLQIRVEPELIQALKLISDNHEITVSALIRFVLTNHCSNEMEKIRQREAYMQRQANKPQRFNR